MPELPEVETVVRGLRATILERRIIGVRIGKSDFIDDPGALAEHLPGAQITAVERFGKFIAISLGLLPKTGDTRPSPVNPDQTKAFLIVHLGMTGQLIPRANADSIAPHTHVFFELDDDRELRYTDARRFGRIAFVPESLIGSFQEKLGADPLEISAKDFVKLFQSRRARVKAMLLDQSVLRGMGNIYADESLWLARIHPARIAANVNAEQLRALHTAMQKVLVAAIKLRGSSISDFLDAEGEPGNYQSRHRVYGRKGKPCPRCHAAIRRIIVAGRSSHFCPQCQSTPRVQKKKPRRRASKRS
jgi:formamidopyrimidine-DNA glycosylase